MLDQQLNSLAENLGQLVEWQGKVGTELERNVEDTEREGSIVVAQLCQSVSTSAGSCVMAGVKYQAGELPHLHELASQLQAQARALDHLVVTVEEDVGRIRVNVNNVASDIVLAVEQTDLLVRKHYEQNFEMVEQLSQVNSEMIAPQVRLEKSHGVVVDEYKGQRKEVVRLEENCEMVDQLSHVNSEVIASHSKLEKSHGVVLDAYKGQRKEVVRLGENSEVIASHCKLEKSHGVVVDEYKEQRKEVVRLGENTGELVRGLGENVKQIKIIQLDGETGEVGSIELLEDCKNVLNKLLKNDYDKFDVLALAQKFEVNLQDEASFSRKKYLLQIKVLENILREEDDEYYVRILEETKAMCNFRKSTGYSCCLVGCLFSTDRHRSYVKHLQQFHSSHQKLACNFRQKCQREFSSFPLLMDHIKQSHSNGNESVDSNRPIKLPVVALACKCSIQGCGGKQFANLQLLMTHINVYHAKEHRSCIFDGCTSQFNPKSVSRNHFRTRHINLNHLKLKEENLVSVSQSLSSLGLQGQDGNVTEDGNESEELEDGNEVYGTDDLNFLESVLEDAEVEDQSNYFLMYYADFLNRMCHVKYVPHKTMQIIASEFLTQSLKSLKVREAKLRESLQNLSNVTTEQIDEIVRKVLFEDDMLNAQKELNTDYKSNKFIQDNFKYVPPLEIVLNKAEVDMGAAKDCFHYIPVTESLKILLEDPTMINVLENTREENRKETGVLRDIKDGSAYKNVQFFQDNPEAYVAMFYSDALELVNPLGASRGKHKVVQIFFNLADMPKNQRSQVDRMQLVMIVREKFIKKYGFGKIYKILLDDLKKLEDGIIVKNPVPRLVKCGVLLHSGDNLESHSVGGFSTNFSSLDICRFCHCQYKDLAENIHGLDGDGPHTFWSIKEYDDICDAIEANEGEPQDFDGNCSALPIDAFEDHLFDEFDEPQDNDDAETEDEEENSDDDEHNETYGLRVRCPFNVLQSFHAVYSFPPDLLHDLLEGRIKSSLLPVLKLKASILSIISIIILFFLNCLLFATYRSFCL